MCLQNFSASISICENSSSSISETELELVDCLTKSFEKKIDDQYTFKVGDGKHYLIGGKVRVDGDEHFSISDLRRIKWSHNVALWLTSDKVNKYLKERIKFYSEKDSLFE